MKIRSVLLLFTALTVTLAAQTGEKIRIEGKVSYISSQNIYTAFENTEGLSKGDTLFTAENKPAVVINFISSKSAAGAPVAGVNLVKDQILHAFLLQAEEKKPEEKKPVIADEETNAPLTPASRFVREKKNYSGRFSVQSMSDFNNLGVPGGQRWRYSLMFNMKEIEGKDLSVTLYSTMSYRTTDWGREGYDMSRFLRLYELSARYSPDSVNYFVLGRNINRKISNLGAIDGLQYEHLSGSYTFGAFAGSRAGYQDYGYDLKLFQLGGYVQRSDSLGSGIMENTFSVVQQSYEFTKTDRRFIYLQHYSTPANRLSFFASSELDLYKVEKGESKQTVDLTSIYLSARFSPVKELNLNFSYDARRNIIYYETFKTFIDSVLENELLQGFRFSTSYRFYDGITIGGSFGLRNRNGDAASNTNYGGYVSWYDIPYFRGNVYLNLNAVKSSYIEGTNYSLTVSKNVIPEIDVNLNLRLYNYKISRSALDVNQKIIGLDVYYSLFRNLSLGASFEGIYETSRSYGRFYIDLTGRL